MPTEWEVNEILKARLDAARGLIDELRNKLWLEQETNALLERKIEKLEREFAEYSRAAVDHPHL